MRGSIRMGNVPCDFAARLIKDATFAEAVTEVPNKITGANSRPVSQFERCGLRQCALMVGSPGRQSGGSAVAQFGRSALQGGWREPSASLLRLTSSPPAKLFKNHPRLTNLG